MCRPSRGRLHLGPRARAALADGGNAELRQLLLYHVIVADVTPDQLEGRKGGVPTAAVALRYLEPPLLRWLYGRKKPNQSFDVALDGDLPRTYDEWDALGRKSADPDKRDGAVLAWERASGTSSSANWSTTSIGSPDSSTPSA